MCDLLNGSLPIPICSPLDHSCPVIFNNGTPLEYLTCGDVFANYSNQENSTVGFERPFVMSFKLKLMWTCLFTLMVLVAIVGNLTVIWIVAAHKRMRSVTNFFLLNLTIADLTMATFNAIFNFVYMLESNWPFGQIYCSLNNFIANLTVAASVFTIAATSFDRYFAIVYPLRPRMSKNKIGLTIILIWTSATFISIPNLLFSRAITYPYVNEERTVCFLVWPDGISGQSTYDYVYNIAFLVLTYVLPMMSMGVTYTHIGCVLWGSQTIGEETRFQKEVIKSKRKVVRMLIVVVIIFALCWLPYHIYFVYTYHYPDVVNQPNIQHIYLAFYWLAMSNSMYNPLVYVWMNQRFRGYFKEALCCRKGNVLLMEVTTNRENSHVTFRLKEKELQTAEVFEMQTPNTFCRELDDH